MRLGKELKADLKNEGLCGLDVMVILNRVLDVGIELKVTVLRPSYAIYIIISLESDGIR